MKTSTLYWTLCGCLLLASCSPQSTDTSEPENSIKTSKTVTKMDLYQPRMQKNLLTHEQAEFRSLRISDVSYNLSFKLTGEKDFEAQSQINFGLSDNSSPLTIDLKEADIHSMNINGVTIESQEIASNYNQWFITIGNDLLKVGENTITVNFNRLHSTNGEGLHRFVDPVDKKVYLYSHFEPAAASQMFALFDQPDLKATYQLTVTAPKDWVVISATREMEIIENADNSTWYFPKTKTLSPYNFSMHAGPYHQWQDNSGKYPMRLFARQSIAKKIVSEDWFKYTNSGLEFFDNYFDTPYPFKKYDQIIVPDFLYGAMENAAAITFAERAFVSNGPMTKARKQRLAGVIMHEMAHQWFGDLVTMKWWNGLWLNESFASFMGTLATAEATEFDYAWRSFYASSKQGAYIQDQRVTTHPIEVPVPTSANAFDNIDAITYSKGASTLIQLRHLLGPKIFQKGVQNYLKKYAYKNATLDDFIGSLGDAAGRSLDGWTQQWLYQAGVNTISTEFSCENNKITQLTLQQTANQKYPVLREQKIQLGLFSLNNNRIQLNKKIPVIYSGKSTVVAEAVGVTCPDLLYPNYQDWGFVKINLDQRSFQTAKKHLSSVSDPLLRSMLWQSLWDSTRDGDLGLNDYLDIALDNVGVEKDLTILSQSLRGISQAMGYVKSLGDKATRYYQQTQPRLEALYWEKAINNQQDENFQRRWLSSFISNAETDSALKKLNQILKGELSIEGITIYQEQRWNMIYQLNRYGYAGSLAMIEQELTQDNGDSGQKQAIAANAIRPDAENKRSWLAKIYETKSELPFSKIRVAMANLYAREQSELIEQTAEEILSKLVALDSLQEAVFMRSYAGSLIPATCNQASVDRLSKIIENSAQLSNMVQRSLLVEHQEDERCVLIGNKFLSTIQPQ